MIRVTIWNENYDERNGVKEVLAVHPDGIHNTLKEIIEEMDGVEVRTATLDQPDCGLSDEMLEQTDVLVWWSHKQHDQVPDELVQKIQEHVLKGMGFLPLHSSHYCKPLKALLGTTCDLAWRDDCYERLFCVKPGHPIAQGVPDCIEVGIDEMYSEPFDIAEPDELIFVAWFDSGNVFRSGCTWTRGYGKIFYFQPGHETNSSYYNPAIRRIIQNGVRWLYNPKQRTALGSPHVEVTLEEQRKQEK